MSERERLREIESIRERETQDGSMCKRRGGGGGDVLAQRAAVG